ncbi:MAG: hypothetical protein AAGJ82_01600, partial [Bacteroidota bacterium]
ATIFLDGTGSSPEGGDYEYEWTTTNGEIISDGNTLFPEIGAPGDYTLVVTNFFSGCTADITITVSGDNTPPVADALVEGDIPCGGGTITIDGSFSTVGENFIYQWTTTNGSIVNGEETVFLTVDAPGDYTLLVTNTINNCSDDVTVAVVQVTGNVDVTITPPADLTCDDTAVILSVENDPGFSFAWSTTNGTLSGPTDQPTATATAAGTYTLNVTDTNTGCTGMTTTTVNLNNTPPTAEAGTAQPLACGSASQTLNGAGSSTGNFSYAWTTTDGTIQSGGSTLMPTITSAGTYTLTVTNDDTGCTALDSVTVVGNSDAPVVTINTPTRLNCNNTSITLIGNNSNNDPSFDLAWTTDGGQFTSGTDGLTPTINAPGMYTLTITNPNNNCSGMAMVNVTIDTIAPVLTIEEPDALDCDESEVSLAATVTGNPDNFTYTWATTDGQILTDGNTAEPTVGQAGSYQVSVTDSNNGCSSTDSVTVTSDTAAPSISLSVNDSLDCGTPVVLLQSMLTSSVADPQYTWSTTNGAITGSTNGSQVAATAAGTYTLLLVNGANSCDVVDSITITRNTEFPTADAGPNFDLDCLNESTVLGGPTTSTGSEFNLQWTSPNVTISGAADQPTLSVAEAGTYYLAVTNTTNDCVSRDTVRVGANTLPPVASVVPPAQITCTDTVSVLDASNSTVAANITYEWTALSGMLVGAADSIIATAGQQGTYQLVVADTDNNCSDTLQVSVTQDANFPTATITPPLELTCDSTTIQLDGQAMSQSGNTSFSWFTEDGSFSDSPTSLKPTVDAPGTYFLAVSDLDNECTAQASVTVLLNDTPPLAEAGTSAPFGCADESLTLDGTGSTAADVNYAWTTTNGHLQSDTSTLTPTVGSSGLYFLQVTNLANGCSAVDSVLVAGDDTVPNVQIAPVAPLDCTTASVTLNTAGSDFGPNFDFVWSSTDAGFASGADGPNPMVNQAGTFNLQITNTDNDCSDTASVTIVQDTLHPQLLPILPDTIDCEQAIAELAFSLTDTVAATYAWSTADGELQGPNDQATATATTGGTYQLLVTNTTNGCATADNLFVREDQQIPNVFVQAALPLTCAMPSRMLNANGSSIGNAFTYQWTTDTGNIIAGAAGLNPIVDAMGTYQILVTNTQNECRDSASITVFTDTIVPAIQLETLPTLTCADTLAVLSALNSTGDDLQFNFSALQGQTLTGADTPMPTVSAAGDYQLLLTNNRNGCSDSLAFTVPTDTLAPVAAILPPAELDCFQNSTTLDASPSTGTSLAYAWSTTNGTLTGTSNTETTTAGQAGQYFLLLTDQSNGCTDSTSVTVNINGDLPEVAIEDPAMINCVTSNVELTANLQGNGGSAPTYAWSTDDGTLASGADTPSPNVTAAGTYSVAVTNTDNNCTGQAIVTVVADLEEPVITIADTDTLNCAVTSVALDASATTGAHSLDYLWTTPDGQLSQDANQAVTATAVPGTYQLVASDPVNFCADTLTVAVVQDTLHPLLNIDDPLVLNCATDSQVLQAAIANGGPNLTLNWATTDGEIASGNGTLTPTITSAGVYQFSVRNTDNQCDATASVTVLEDVAAPAIAIAEPSTLTCVLDTVQLDATTSASGSNIAYIWTTTDGQLQSGTHQDVVIANAPGTYDLLIENTDNNCTSTASVTVVQNVTLPLADAGDDFDFGCDTPTSNLDGGGSSLGADFVYEWLSLTGQNVDNGTSLNPIIVQGGTYQLTVENLVNGCTAVDEVTVSQDAPTATLAITEPLCFGEAGSIRFSTTEGGTPPYLYSVDGGERLVSNSFFTDLPAGSYVALVEDSNGCSYEEEIVITQPDSVQVVFPAEEIEITFGAPPAQLMPQSSYDEADLTFISWDNPQGLSCDDCLFPFANPERSVVYRLRVATAAGCADEALLRVIVRRDFPVYFPTAFAPTGSGQNDIFLPFAKEGVINTIRSFAVYNRWGEQVHLAENFPANEPEFGWDGKHRGRVLNSAVFVYLAEIEFADGSVEVLQGEVLLLR